MAAHERDSSVALDRAAGLSWAIGDAPSAANAISVAAHNIRDMPECTPDYLIIGMSPGAPHCFPLCEA